MYAYVSVDAILSLDHPTSRWLKRVARDAGPLYVALADALAEAVREGELQPGDQLPPQRTVAGLLGVDFTTVTRAYGLARSRGLLEGAVGRGTFVSRLPEDEAGVVDLSMNLPPPPAGVSLAALLRETTGSILGAADAATLMSYHAGPGTIGQRSAAAAWLAPSMGQVALDRVTICAGAQTGLAAVLASLMAPGDALVVEPLTYPGLVAAAAARSLRLAPCAFDDDGFVPEALERLCAEQRPAAIYVTPTTRNPLATTMSEGRRRQVAEIARKADIAIIEDDPYARLEDAVLPALAALAPERTWHVATLSKCLSPGLRVAFLVAPDVGGAARLAEALRALSLMPPPLMAAVATRWIREGSAEQLLAGVRREARARRALAAERLPAARGASGGLHVWLDLPGLDASARLRALARDRGLALVTAEAFATSADHPGGMRISLGGPGSRAVLAQALDRVAALLAGGGGAIRPVV
jgi:DNA-binding transcriptional MocR family regulator